MRAIIVNEFGGPEVLRLADAKRPDPASAEVLVRVHAASVNPVDAAVRSGRYPLLGAPPFILGWDVAGVVEEADNGSPLRPGDEVFGMPKFPNEAGGYAEYVAAPSRHFARKPAGLSFVDAAAIPLAGLTAWQALVDMAGLVAGQRVLVHAAGGGVGHFAVQIAKALGAEVVATASPNKRDFVLSLGADDVIDYTASRFEEHIRDIDVVLDTVGGDYADRSIAVLRPGGSLISVVGRQDAALAARVTQAGRRFAGVAVEPDLIGLRALAALVDSGQLRPHVSATFPLDEAAAAHEALAGVVGKIVLTL